jgi:Tripartite tricarboxylate transporter family receptor
MQHVPYRGAGPALSDLVGGQVQIMFDNASASIEHIRAGKLRPFAVTTTTRWEGLDTGLKNRSERAISLENTWMVCELTLRANCPQCLGRQSLGATLPPREQFVPCGVDPHRRAPYQDRPCVAGRSGVRESARRLVPAIGRTILRTRTRTRNGDHAHGRDLIAYVSWRVSLHLPAFAGCVPALLADVPWQPQPPHRV